MNRACGLPSNRRAIRRWLKALEARASPERDVQLAIAPNLEALAALPAEVRLRRMQAIERFPALVLPMLLSVEEVLSRGEFDIVSIEIPPSPVAEVVAAIDTAASPVPPLARFYGVSLGFVRSDLHRRYWHASSLSARGLLLRFLACLPNEYRPRSPEEWAEHVRRAEDYLRLLGCEDTVPSDRSWRTLHCRALPRGFGAGFARIAELEATHGMELADASELFEGLCDVVRLVEPSWQHLTPTALARGWVEVHGLESVMVTAAEYAEALRSLHLRRYSRVVDRIPAIVGEFAASEGRAVELVSREALSREGSEMAHCVSQFWHRCVTGARAFALETVDGERATAFFVHSRSGPLSVGYRLDQVRGPRNAQPGARVMAFVERLEQAINDPAREAARRRAVTFLYEPDPAMERILSGYRVRPSWHALPRGLAVLTVEVLERLNHAARASGRATGPPSGPAQIEK